MSKRDIKPHSGGKVMNTRKKALQVIIDEMNREEREKDRALNRKEELGPRKQILAAYEVNSDINDAIAVMNDINNKIGKRAYTEEMIKAWIQEYKNKNNSREDEVR